VAPGARVRGDLRVGAALLAGGSQLRAPPAHLRVPASAPLHGESDSRAAAGGIEDGRVEASDQRLEALGWRGRVVGHRYSGRARPTLSATHTGLSPPSASPVNFVPTWTQPPSTSSTDWTSPRLRSL